MHINKLKKKSLSFGIAILLKQLKSDFFATSWTSKKTKSLCQAAVSMEFSSQEYWTGLPFPSPGELPDPEIEPGSPALQANLLYIINITERQYTA